MTLLTLRPIAPENAAQWPFDAVSLDESPPFARSPKKFVAWVRDHRPDVIFFNSCNTFDACIPHLPPRVRCVFVVHDTQSRCWRPALRYETNLDAIVAVSNAVAKRFEHRLHDNMSLRIVSNGAPEEPPSGHVAPRRNDDLVFMGGDDPKKGCYDVLKLWPMLVKAGFPGRLHWFGDIDSGLLSEIDEIVARGRIVIHAHAPRAEIYATLRASKVLLMLSRSEPFGVATAEAMSMKCVPVAWDLPGDGTDEVVGDAPRFFAPLGDYEALANQVLTALRRQDEVGPRLAERAHMHFSATSMWNGYARLIEELSTRAEASRPYQGIDPPDYRPPIRATQLIPARIRTYLRRTIGKLPILDHHLRKLVT